MASFANTFLQGLINPTYQQGLFTAAQGVGSFSRRQKEAEDLARMKNMSPVEQADFMMSRAKTPEQLQTAAANKTIAVRGAGQESLALLQQRMGDAQRRMSEFSALGNVSQTEAIKAEMEQLEDAMVAVSRQTGQANMAQFMGEADRREAAVRQAEYEAINTQATVLGNKIKLGKASLQQYPYGSAEYKEQVKLLQQQGLQQSVDLAEKEHLELETARAKHTESIGRAPTDSEIKEMQQNGVTVPDDPLGQKVAWRSYSKNRLEKEVAAATSGLDPVTSARAEGVVSFVLNRIAAKGDYVDIFSDDIASVVESLTDEQKNEIADLITGKPENEVAVLVEAWLRENYPEPFAKSEKFAEQRDARRSAKTTALKLVFDANPDLDPNDPVDIRLAEQALKEQSSTELNVETGVGTPFIPASAL
jgi:hypothetical protein